MSLSVEAFVERLNESRVTTPDEVSAVLSTFAEDTRPVDGSALAQVLVERALLTDFQVRTILDETGEPLTLGPYVLLEPIGQGGTGMVYKAWHRPMKRYVALKVLHADLSDSADVLERFQREMRAGGKLSHPHIVSTLDADHSGEMAYLAMEYVPGTDLATLVSERGTVSPRDAARYIAQAAEGLAYAHEQGVIHRDVKPSNLLLADALRTTAGSTAGAGETAKPLVKVLDLGLARFLSSETQGDLTGTGDVMGTADYMAPEQAVNTRDVDARADVYSLGCTLFFLLNGRPPYSGETAVSRLLAHRDRPIPPLGESHRAVPAELNAIFQRMVAKRKEDRYATMHEVRAALDEFLIQSEVSPGSRLAQRWLAWTIGLGTAAALAVAFVANQGNISREPQETTHSLTAAGDSTSDGSTNVHPITRPVPEPPTPTEILTSDAWEWSAPVEVGGGVNAANHINFAAELSDDGKTLIFARGPGPDSIWISRRPGLDRPWEEAVQLPSPINLPSTNNLCPTISGDGRILIFASDRDGSLGAFDLWMSTRANPNDSFGEPVHLEGDINSTDTDRAPFLSVDGLTLIVSSARSGGEGRCDLWMATRSSTEAPFGPLVNMGSNINGPLWDESATLSSDGLTLIFGQMDELKPDQNLMISTRPSRDAPFEPATALGPPINTSHFEFQPSLSHDGRQLYFHSSRPEGPGGWNIYMSERVPKLQPPTD